MTRRKARTHDRGRRQEREASRGTTIWADPRIAYGAGCTWWDSIALASRRDSAIALPCCPHCEGLLFEYSNIEQWWAGVAHAERTQRPGMRKVLEWARGKCFPNVQELRAAYIEATGEEVPTWT